MKIRAESQPTRSGISRGVPCLSGVVTNENFVEKSIGFMRASGRIDGEHPVVKRDLHRRAWMAWMAYFQKIGRKSAFAQSMGVMTLPTEYPWDFSVDADEFRHTGEFA